MYHLSKRIILQGKRICCSGFGTWTRVIGWFRLALSIILITVFTAYFVPAVLSIPRFPWSYSDWYRDYRIGIAFAVVWGTLLLSSVLSLIMDLILLRGVYHKKPKYLHAWIVVGVLLLVLCLLSGVLFCVFSSEQVVLALFLMILDLAVEGFCIWVVNSHKKELEAASTKTPVPKWESVKP